MGVIPPSVRILNQLSGLHIVVGCGVDFYEGRIVERSLGDQSHIVGGGIMIFIIQSAGIGKMGVGAA